MNKPSNNYKTLRKTMGHHPPRHVFGCDDKSVRLGKESWSDQDNVFAQILSCSPQSNTLIRRLSDNLEYITSIIK